MSDFADTPKPPYHVVCFSSQLVGNPEGYQEVATKMLRLATEIDGYLGVETARDVRGFGITNSFWRDEVAITSWREHAQHKIVREIGREKWYDALFTRVARVERDYRG